jgi:uncharacterized protein (TIGR01777 family)
LLKGEGYTIAPMVRRESKGDEISWDPETGQVDFDKLAGVEAVVHLAGEPIGESRWTEGFKEKIINSRVKGTETIARACAALQLKTLVSASAVGFYGDTGKRVADERCGKGKGFLAEVCDRWEKAADSAREAGVRVVHPRIGVVLSKEGGALPKMLGPFKWGLGAVMGSGEQFMPWIGLEDTARGLSFLLEKKIEGPVNLCGPEPVSNREFTRVLSKSLSRSAWLWVPGFLVEGGLGELGRELVLQGQRAVPRRLLEGGFQFKVGELGELLQEEGR